jgi:hypothetical protein
LASVTIVAIWKPGLPLSTRRIAEGYAAAKIIDPATVILKNQKFATTERGRHQPMGGRINNKNHALCY